MTQETVPEPLKNIIYIKLPEGFARDLDGFALDPAIPLPVEPPADVVQWQMNDLTWEMIIAAMIRILTYQPQHPHGAYYKKFIFMVKPNIVAELTEAAVVKAKALDFYLAEEIFLSLVQLTDGHINSLLNLAFAYEKHADFAREKGQSTERERYTALTFETYKKALKTAPTAMELHYHLADFYLKQSNFSKAKEHFKVYLELGSDVKRRAEVEKILKAINAQDKLDALLKEGYDFIQLGKEEQGIQKIKQFLKVNPGVWNGWFLLGWAYRRLQKYGDGREALGKALAIHGNHVDSLNELAICEMELHQYQESEAHLKRALNLEPENTKILSNLGMVALGQQRNHEAEAYFKRVLDLDPKDPLAIYYLTRV